MRKKYIVSVSIVIYLIIVSLFVFRDTLFPADVCVGQVWVLKLGSDDNPFDKGVRLKLKVVAVSKYYVKSLRYIDYRGDSIFDVSKRRIFRYDWAERIK